MSGSAYVATWKVGGDLSGTLELIRPSVGNRLSDLGEAFASGVSADSLLDATGRSGIPTDTAVHSWPEGSGSIRAVQGALTAVLSGMSELTVASLTIGGLLGERTGAVCIASEDFMRHAGRPAIAELRGSLMAGFDADRPDQDVRSAMERCLVRAEITAEDLAEVLVIGTEVAGRIVSEAVPGAPVHRVPSPGDALSRSELSLPALLCWVDAERRLVLAVLLAEVSVS